MTLPGPSRAAGRLSRAGNLPRIDRRGGLSFHGSVDGTTVGAEGQSTRLQLFAAWTVSAPPQPGRAAKQDAIKAQCIHRARFPNRQDGSARGLDRQTGAIQGHDLVKEDLSQATVGAATRHIECASGVEGPRRLSFVVSRPRGFGADA